MAFVKFMASKNGRLLRIVAGVALIALGALNGAWLLAVIGLVPLAAGAADICLFAPLMGQPLSGKAIRGK
jgi:hypothetical protein